MVLRNIIRINKDLCDGCKICEKACPEGALKVIDKKAHLISEIACDGLGACISVCPQNALEVVEEDVLEYDEVEVIKKIIPQGQKVIKEHLTHLKEHGLECYFEQAKDYLISKDINVPSVEVKRRKADWPIQLGLIAPHMLLDEKSIVLAADCTAFCDDSNARYRAKGRLIIACPKLDDAKGYIEKLTKIFDQTKIETVTIVRMEVPCCAGLNQIIKLALLKTKKEKEIIIFEEVIKIPR